MTSATTSAVATLSPFSMILKPSSMDFRYDKREDGWKLIEPGKPVVAGEVKLELVEILQATEEYIDGICMLKRAKELGNHTSQFYAERMLDQQKNIPQSFRPFRLLFIGTVWLDFHSLHYVPCLSCHGYDWHLGFNCIEIGYVSRCRFVLLGK